MAYIGKEPTFGAFEKQIITGDGSNATFNLTHSVASSSSILVSLGGVIQEPSLAYDLAFSSGQQQITFSFTPSSGTRKVVSFVIKDVYPNNKTDDLPNMNNIIYK